MNTDESFHRRLTHKFATLESQIASNSRADEGNNNLGLWDVERRRRHAAAASGSSMFSSSEIDDNNPPVVLTSLSNDYGGGCCRNLSPLPAAPCPTPAGAFTPRQRLGAVEVRHLGREEYYPSSSHHVLRSKPAVHGRRLPSGISTPPVSASENDATPNRAATGRRRRRRSSILDVLKELNESPHGAHGQHVMIDDSNAMRCSTTFIPRPNISATFFPAPLDATEVPVVGILANPSSPVSGGRTTERRDVAVTQSDEESLWSLLDEFYDIRLPPAMRHSADATAPPTRRRTEVSLTYGTRGLERDTPEVSDSSRQRMQALIGFQEKRIQHLESQLGEIKALLRPSVEAVDAPTAGDNDDFYAAHAAPTTATAATNLRLQRLDRRYLAEMRRQNNKEFGRDLALGLAESLRQLAQLAERCAEATRERDHLLPQARRVSSDAIRTIDVSTCGRSNVSADNADFSTGGILAKRIQQQDEVVVSLGTTSPFGGILRYFLCCNAASASNYRAVGGRRRNSAMASLQRISTPDDRQVSEGSARRSDPQLRDHGVTTVTRSTDGVTAAEAPGSTPVKFDSSLFRQADDPLLLPVGEAGEDDVGRGDDVVSVNDCSHHESRGISGLARPWRRSTHSTLQFDPSYSSNDLSPVAGDSAVSDRRHSTAQPSGARISTQANVRRRRIKICQLRHARRPRARREPVECE